MPLLPEGKESEMTNEPSPRQWRVNGHSIEANDPDGLWLQNEKTGRGVVANLPSCPKSRMSVKNRKTWDAIVEANAALIVDAVNERDRLRDIIKRLITVREKVFWRKDEKTGLMYETCLMDEDEARKTIEEAKAAIKEDKE